MTETNEYTADDIRRLEELKANGTLPADFADRLIVDLRQKQTTYVAKLAGDGANAQGTNSTAIGKQGVRTGDIHESVVNTGTLNIFFNQYLAPSGKAQLSKGDFKRILKDYLNWAVRAYGKARLYGLEDKILTGEQPRRQLADVFVPLSLRRFSPPRREEIEELVQEFKGSPQAWQRAYLRAVESHRTDGDEIPLKTLLTIKDWLAVVGGAGCGKSTLAAYLAANLAEAALTGSKSVFDLPEGHEQLLPLVIPLRYLREYRRLCGESPQEKIKNPRAGKLAGLIPWYLMWRNPACELSQDFFDRMLLGGGCLLILDGLDEVVNRDERVQVRAQVEEIANDIYPGNLVMVTARESGYREDAVFGEDFIRLDIQPLDDEQIATLVKNWCQQLYPEAVKAKTDEIVAAIQHINRRYEAQHLPRLISTPLMTTMVISVRWGENELPRERARLYEAAVQVIIQAQYLDNDEAQQELVNWGGAWEEQRQWLSFLALAMHHGGSDGAAIPEERVRTILFDYPGMTKEKLNNFIQAVRLRGGLFEERAELFQFAHLTFQEFLAARLLVQQRQAGLSTLCPFVGDAWWREVCLLFYGIAKKDYEVFAAEYLEWLGTLEPGEKRLAALELAAAAILEIEKPDLVLRNHRARLLLSAFEGANLSTSPAVRVRAGNTLGALGDPRFDPDHWFLPKDGQLGFIHIPAGHFIMGSDPVKDPVAEMCEQPEHKLYLPDYWIAKYPVTVAQFRVFVETTSYYFDNWKLNTNPTHPVVVVTWPQALAYCDWLETRMKTWAMDIVKRGQPKGRNCHCSLAFDLLKDPSHVTLPSEAEWEKAARGTDGRVYPWVGPFDKNRANTEETGIGITSPVGAFPGGQSQYGVMDLVGNVWEWTRTIWDAIFTYPYTHEDGREDTLISDAKHALHGGAFGRNHKDSRCTFRNWDGPNFWNTSYGFRIVISPAVLTHSRSCFYRL